MIGATVFFREGRVVEIRILHAKCVNVAAKVLVEAVYRRGK